MSLQPTNLLIQMAPLPQTFSGTPQQWATEIIKRLRIVSASGTNFIFIGDTEPTSNVGPWLKNGTQWWVWDDDIKRYQPLDISESETKWFWMGNTIPTSSTPPVWLKTTKDQTEDDPSHGEPLGWYVFNGTAWVPYNSIVLSGATANRPVSPVEYQQFYDTDVSVLIWWERNKWRTVSGVPGDVKSVAFETLTDALLHNPGWDVLGAANQNLRGRIIMQATKDSGGSPATDLSVVPGIAKRAAFETFGETDGVKIDSSSSVPYPPELALWHLVKG